MKVMLFGSRNIHWIPKRLWYFLGTFVNSGDEFIVGDCQGADIAFQKVLKARKAPFEVYHIGLRARNTLGPTIAVPGNKYSNKDDVMIAECDAAICIHTGSPGSLRNIQKLKVLGKPVWEYGPEELVRMDQ